MSRRAVELLREKGARNIGCVCGATVVESETKYRYTAYLDAMRDCGAEPHLLLMQFRHGQEMDVLRKFFSLYPDTDGLFTGSDMLASAAYHVAVMHGVRVPDRLQIVGYDGILDAWDSLPQTDNGAAGHSQNGAERRGIAPCPHHRQERSRKGRDPRRACSRRNDKIKEFRARIVRRKKSYGIERRRNSRRSDRHMERRVPFFTNARRAERPSTSRAAVRRFGADSAFVGCVGADTVGAFLEKFAKNPRAGRTRPA